MMLVKMCISIALGSLGTHRRASGVNVPDQHVYKASGCRRCCSVLVWCWCADGGVSDVVNAIGGNTFSHLCGQIYKQCSCFLVESMLIDDKKDLYLIAIPYFLLQASEVN